MPQVESHVDSRFLAVATLRKVLEGDQRLFEVSYRLAVGRTARGLHPGLAKIAKRLWPNFTGHGVLGEPLDVSGKTIRVFTLDRLDNPCMKFSPSLWQETLIRHVVRQGMLERVYEIRSESPLVEEFGCLKMVQAAVEIAVWHFRDFTKQIDWHINTDHGRRLEQRSLVWWKLAHPGGHQGLDRWRRRQDVDRFH